MFSVTGPPAFSILTCIIISDSRFRILIVLLCLLFMPTVITSLPNASLIIIYACDGKHNTNKSCPKKGFVCVGDYCFEGINFETITSQTKL